MTEFQIIATTVTVMAITVAWAMWHRWPWAMPHHKQPHQEVVPLPDFLEEDIRKAELAIVENAAKSLAKAFVPLGRPPSAASLGISPTPMTYYIGGSNYPRENEGVPKKERIRPRPRKPLPPLEPLPKRRLFVPGLE